MNNLQFADRFEDLLYKMFKAFDFVVRQGILQTHSGQRFEIDFLLDRNQFQTVVEVKFYRTKQSIDDAVRQAAQRLIQLATLQERPVSGLLVISAYAERALKEELAAMYGISIWDRNDLYNLIKFGVSDAQLFADFEQLLNEAKQGVDTESVFADANSDGRVPGDLFQLLQIPTKPPVKIKPVKVKDYCAELKAIPAGRLGWRAYELKCIEILKHLFSRDLENWNTQRATDDELSRFDMICRVISRDDFWRSLIQSFQSRYVLFEFKNYADEIGQDQIYTTERYLYLRGLRSVGFIIARKGGSPQAFKAAKGALREHGKLILILDNDDLCTMLEMKEEGKIPSDHLSVKLDEFLISLSR